MPKNRVRLFERTLDVCQFHAFPKKIARLIGDACARACWRPPWLAKSSFGARHAAVRLIRRSSATTYAMKPLSYDPNRIRGMSERMIISHYENNDSGVVKRLNLIEEKLAEIDYATARRFPDQRAEA